MINKSKYSYIDKNFLILEFVNNKKDINAIAKESGCSKDTIYHRLKFYNLYEKRYQKRFDLISQKFERLTVVEFSKIDSKGQAVWKCLCECGNTKLVKGTSLRQGRVKSCGCYRFDIKYKGGKYITGQEFSNIKQNAKKRNIEFNITIADIEKQYKKQSKLCVYSGEYLFFNGLISEGSYNGNASIDRKNSKKGYTKSNIQIVHKIINVAKHVSTDKKFIEMCAKITKYQNKLKRQQKERVN